MLFSLEGDKRALPIWETRSIDARLGSINNVTRTHCPLFAALSKTGPGWEMVAAGEIMEQQRDKVFFRKVPGRR